MSQSLVLSTVAVEVWETNFQDQLDGPLFLISLAEQFQ